MVKKQQLYDLLYEWFSTKTCEDCLHMETYKDGDNRHPCGKCESSVVKGMKIACVNGDYLGYVNHVSIDYSLEEVGIYPECLLFPTKEELIKSL